MAANLNSLDLENTSNQRAEVDISATDGISALTVMCWIKPESLTVNDHFLTQWPSSDTDNKWIFRVDSTTDEVKCFIASSTTDDTNFATSTDMDIVVNVWKHIAFVYDGSLAAANRVKFFADGLEKTASITGTIPTALTTPTDKAFAVGARADATTADYDGLIDEVRLFYRALTANEIANYMFSDRVETNYPYWPLNNNYNDSSGAGLTLTAINTPVFSTDVPYADYRDGGLDLTSKIW